MTRVSPQDISFHAGSDSAARPLLRAGKVAQRLMIPSCCVSCASVRPACCQVSRHHEPSTTADSASRSQTMATFQSSTNRLALLVVGLLAVMGQSAEQRPHLRGLAQPSSAEAVKNAWGGTIHPHRETEHLSLDSEKNAWGGTLNQPRHNGDGRLLVENEQAGDKRAFAFQNTKRAGGEGGKELEEAGDKRAFAFQNTKRAGGEGGKELEEGGDKSAFAFQSAKRGEAQSP